MQSKGEEESVGLNNNNNDDCFSTLFFPAAFAEIDDGI